MPYQLFATGASAGRRAARFWVWRDESTTVRPNTARPCRRPWRGWSRTLRGTLAAWSDWSRRAGSRNKFPGRESGWRPAVPDRWRRGLRDVADAIAAKPIVQLRGRWRWFVSRIGPSGYQWDASRPDDQNDPGRWPGKSRKRMGMWHWLRNRRSRWLQRLLPDVGRIEWIIDFDVWAEESLEFDAWLI